MFEYAKKVLSRWYRVLTDRHERHNYFVAEGTKLIWIFLYTALNIALFVEAAVRWNNTLAASGISSTWIVIARGFGQLLNLNCAVIMVPITRTLLSWARILKLNNIIPIDKNIIFHRFIAYWTLFCAVVHGCAHYFNYVCCYDNLYRQPSIMVASWRDKFGLTGNLILFIMILMYAASDKTFRHSKNFTIFWYLHHCFMAFFVLLLIHGRNFWKWFVGPAFLYLLERLLRVLRGSRKAQLKTVRQLSSETYVLEIANEKGTPHRMTYQAGQYCFICCPFLSVHEWHPFTISSAPHEDILTFHIRVVGDWTTGLRDLLNPNKRQTLVLNKPLGPDGKTHILKIDGPFGAPAEHVYQYEYIVLVSAGIGVTPYASVLKDIQNAKRTNTACKIKKVWFYWMNREEGAFTWFSELLAHLEAEDPAFFEIHTYMTGEMKVDDIRNIIISSDEFLSHSQSRHPVSPLPSSSSRAPVPAPAQLNSSEIQANSNSNANQSAMASPRANRPLPPPPTPKPNSNNSNSSNSNNVNITIQNNPHEPVMKSPVMSPQPIKNTESVILLARATMKYKATASDELSFSIDDIIEIKQRDDSGWWYGTNKKTKASGLFPGEYVVLIDKATQLRNNANRHFGRPVWPSIFPYIANYVASHSSKPSTKVGVFFCGPQVISKELYKFCVSSGTDKVQFSYLKENF